jgi:hypothetical protein
MLEQQRGFGILEFAVSLVNMHSRVLDPAARSTAHLHYSEENEPVSMLFLFISAITRSRSFSSPFN